MIRPLLIDDAASAEAVHRTSFTHNPWPAQAFRDLLETGAFGFLALAGNKANGLILAREAADEAEILTFAVIPSARRGKIGTDLLEKTCDTLHIKGIARLILEVGESNEAAINLYKKLNFIQFGERAGYYQHANNIEHAILMEKLLNI